MSNESMAPLCLLSDRETAPAPSRVEDEVVALFEQFRNPLLRYLISLGSTVQDGEEIVQEVFIALFQHLNRGKFRSNLRSWLFRVAHNLALKRRRSLYVRSEVSLPSVEGMNAIDTSLNPEEALEQGQTQRRITSVISALPEQEKRCLYLRAEGLRYREIAEVLAISLGSVSLSLERALTKVTRVRDR